MTNHRGTMDPDRFQMKDIKRRLTRIEKNLARLTSKLRDVTDQCNSHEVTWPGDPLPDKDQQAAFPKVTSTK